MMKLKDNIAVITGGSSGIGASIARLFAREGANVIIVFRSNEKEAHALAEEITSAGGMISCKKADLGCESEVSRLFSEINDTYGHIDILINNAGRTFNVPFQEITEESFLNDLQTNLLGTVLCSKYAAPLMGEIGSIVNTASIRGMFDSGRPGIMGYCAAKAGVISFTKNLALELAPRITVNAVAPGFVYTQYMEKNISDEMKQSWLDNIPLEKFVDINALAEVYLFLATNREITGTVLPVDGGYTMINR